MGLKERLSSLLWPEDTGDPDAERRSAEASPPPATPAGPTPPAPPASRRAERPSAGEGIDDASAEKPAAPGLVDRLKQVGVSPEQRERTPHLPGPARPEPEAGRPRTGPSLRQRLQQVGVPDWDAKELARQQRILEASREAGSRARREAAYATVSTTCPLPIHAERVPLPGGLRLLDEEFLVASGPNLRSLTRELTLTTQRLIYTRGRAAERQLVVYLADICDIAFHEDDTVTIGTPSGRWERLSVAGNSVVASRDQLLALVGHARAERAAPAASVEPPAAAAAGRTAGEESTAGTGAPAAIAPRRTRPRRHVEVAGRPAPRSATAAPAAAAGDGDGAAAEPEPGPEPVGPPDAAPAAPMASPEAAIAAPVEPPSTGEPPAAADPDQAGGAENGAGR
jgi:hypothetical protein